MRHYGCQMMNLRKMPKKLAAWLTDELPLAVDPSDYWVEPWDGDRLTGKVLITVVGSTAEEVETKWRSLRIALYDGAHPGPIRARIDIKTEPDKRPYSWWEKLNHGKSNKQ